MHLYTQTLNTVTGLLANEGSFGLNLDIFEANLINIVILGGGIFADSVRKVYSDVNMTEKTGNFLALKSTEIFSHMINQMCDYTCLVSNLNDLKRTLNIFIY